MLKYVLSDRIFKTVGFSFLIAAFIFATQSESHAQKRSRKGWLGVTIREMTPSMMKDYKLGNRMGILITSVSENSPAEDAGLWEDDVILKYDGKAVVIADEFSKMVRKTKPKTNVKILIMRDGNEKEVEVTIGRRKERHAVVWSDDNLQIFFGRPQLGVQVHDLDSDLAEYFNVDENEGVLVIEVTEDSPAEAAGLKAGDVITTIDEEKIFDHEDLLDVLEDYDDGDIVTVHYVRKGKKQKAEVELEGSHLNRRYFGSGMHPGFRLRKLRPPKIHLAPKMRFEFRDKSTAI